jgi:hypothetical protein
MNEKGIHDLIRQMKKSGREHMHGIWKKARSGEMDSLSQNDRNLARIMLEHGEYHNQFEFADHLSDHEFDVDKETNPFLHIVIHLVVQNQISSREPIEVYQFYNAMLRKKVTIHEAMHLIGTIFSYLLFGVLKHGEEFDMEKYKSLLRKYKVRNPDKIPASLDREFD